ncbi:MAG: hypothetical protein A3F14_04345 [Gammaproteobacteria bacterium RIFCSPHIGHO2_12_FULL_43_28]|nr:MAG: hypothetical protein A3F14_04345 [Gammaproteobacteria bacterium RIFCSPHIGHO2_12_FULL_43_28]
MNSRKLAPSEELLQQLRSAATEVGPRTYQLKINSDQLKFFALGCQGSGGKAQKAVAALMDQIAQNPSEKPDFILLLGDNFYNSGVSSVFDPAFKDLFIDIYGNVELNALKDIPCIVIPGNHDANRHVATTLGKKGLGVLGLNFAIAQGIPKINYQIDHSYLPDTTNNFPTIEAKKLFYQQLELKVDELPKWNMPARFYSLVIGKVQLFCIDSNTYVNDYLNLGKNHDRYNQAGWLQEQVKLAKEAGRQTILALHHPPFTVGRRAYDASDSDIYLSCNELTLLKEDKFPEKASYNDLLKECFTRQQLSFNLILTAHDHDLYYYNNGEFNPQNNLLTQLTLGGGGSELQARLNFTNQQYMGTFLRENGFGIITCDTKQIQPVKIDIYSTKNHHLKFITDHCKPIRFYPQTISQTEQKDIENICVITQKAINKYFDFLANQQDDSSGSYLSLFSPKGNITHGQGGVERAHQLWAYISQTTADNYTDTIKRIYELAHNNEHFFSASEHSLITLLDAQIKKDLLGNTLETLYRSVSSSTFKH